MAKCEICKNPVQETFLQKRIGTVIKDEAGKKYDVCAECQKKFSSKGDMLKAIK